MAPTRIIQAPPGFHAMVLAIGFIVGGAMQQVARMFLPARRGEAIPHGGRHAIVRAVARIDLVILKFSLGPVALDVSLLSLVGVLVAYLIARSLFLGDV